MAATPKIERGRTFAMSIKRVAADRVTPVDWPAGDLTAEVRTGPDGGLLVAFTVDATNRLAANGGVVVLRLTDEQTEAITVRTPTTGVADVQFDNGGVLDTAVPTFRIQIVDAPTGRTP